MAHLDASGITRLVTDLKDRFATLVSGAVPIAQGGTGATTAAGAATNIVDGQALAPTSVTATGEVTATSGTVTHDLTDKAESSAIAAVEQATATANHAVGSYFMLDGKLMRATAAIATGDAITAANATAATVQSEIDGLKSKSYAEFNSSSLALEEDFSFHNVAGEAKSAWRKAGDTATIALAINVDTSLPVGVKATVGTITDATLRPKMNMSAMFCTFGDNNPILVRVEISTSGELTFVPIISSIPSGKYVVIHMLYVIDY